MPNGPELTAADFIRYANLDGSSSFPLINSFVAEVTEENQKKVVGYTISYFSFSTWQGRSFFFDDFYVKPDYRKFGIGKKLFVENVRLARQEGCKRFDLHCLDWNPATKFYESLGVTNYSASEGWQYFRMTEDKMDLLLADQH
jgi:diamine N-acetyltransferase